MELLQSPQAVQMIYLGFKFNEVPTMVNFSRLMAYWKSITMRTSTLNMTLFVLSKLLVRQIVVTCPASSRTNNYVPPNNIQSMIWWWIISSSLGNKHESFVDQICLWHSSLDWLHCLPSIIIGPTTYQGWRWMMGWSVTSYRWYRWCSRPPSVKL